MTKTDEELTKLVVKDDACYHASFYGKVTSTRYKIALLGFTGFGVLFSMRVTMSIAIVDMVTDQGTKDGSFNENCPIPDRGNFTAHSTVRNFNWSTTEQAHILVAPFYGYIVAQLPGSYLATVFGGKKVFGYSVLVKSFLIVLNPPIAYLGIPWLFTLRLVEGILEGFTVPTFSHFSARWAPEFERTVFYGVTFSGCSLGLIICYAIVGVLCTVEFLEGWPLGFAFNGFIGIIWFIAWMYEASDSPDSHPRISEGERKYINDSTKVDDKIKPKVPWLKMLTSLPFHAFVIVNMSILAVDYAILTCLPLYFSNVLNFDVDTDGYFCAIPWFLCLLGSIFASVVTDQLRSNNIVSTTVIRKINQNIASLLTAAFLISAGYAECRSALAVSFISIAMFFFGFHFAGGYCINLDIAPYFAGITNAISTVIASIFGAQMPIAIDLITQDNIHSTELWLYCFYLIGAILVIGCILFSLFASGEVQPWANPEIHQDSYNGSGQEAEELVLKHSPKE